MSETRRSSQGRRLRKTSRTDDLRPADESPGDEQAGIVGLRSSVAGAGVLDDPGRKVPFEGVDRGLEHTAVGVDAADVEVGPAMLVDELGALLGEQRVDALVDHWTLPDVGCEFGDQLGVRCVGHCGPADEPLVGAADVVEVAGEHQVAASGPPAACQRRTSLTMTGTTGAESSVMNPFCTSTTMRTGLRSLISRPIAFSEDLDRLAQVPGEAAGLDDSLSHRPVLRGLLGSLGGEPRAYAAQEAPAELSRHHRVAPPFDLLTQVVAVRPHGLHGSCVHAVASARAWHAAFGRSQRTAATAG